jgi:transcriptional regulator with XRE-family HTH domain
MPKVLSPALSKYSRDALSLLGALIREARLTSTLTTTEVSTRAGISRGLLQRIERGDPGCGIGAVFEVAAIVGVPLFEMDERLLPARLARQTEKMALLPKSVRAPRTAVNDDF